MKEITKLVLPVAGLGKRLQPLTIKTPKALVRANGKPLLDYVLEETRGTTIKEAILIINPKQRRDFEVYIQKAKRKFPNLKFKVKNQKLPLGTGHVLLIAGEFVMKESFAVRFADDILVSKKPVLPALINSYYKTQSSVLTLRKVPKKLVSRFGVVAAKKVFGVDGVLKISKIIEKPKLEEAPSDLVLLGAYILSPEIMRQEKILEDRYKGELKSDCFKLTDAFDLALKKKEKIFGWEFKGKYLDCGTLEAFSQAEKYLRNKTNKLF